MKRKHKQETKENKEEKKEKLKKKEKQSVTFRRNKKGVKTEERNGEQREEKE